ncbi:unnamed protein product [Caenorhabditis bovis]|uniref:BHLH domain-containing protein n=1 Tax=Caenorhabditis bovis TaxID=2654633 RepID=A0A8S1ERH5_9PELO|nr:unnamed protein product [Caenorhabditis bovis]
MAFTGRAQVIHSGHFMTSNLHNDDAQADDDDEDIEVDVVQDDEKSEETTTIKNKQLDEKPVTFYKFGPKKTQSIAIDVSLNKLNKCIKVAYNKMTTPKWKDFKGLRLHWKQRIRLNNVIWRAYYIEFRRKAPVKPKKPFCYFAVPDDDTTHQKIEGAVMEGMYWKRRMEAVCAQYKSWRVRSRHTLLAERGMVATCSSNSISSIAGDLFKRKRKANSIERTVKITEPPNKMQRSQTPKHLVSEEWNYDDDMNNVFTDELFDSLSQPYMFPNPKEMMSNGNADFMQPGLLPLQPTIEEIMASLDNFPDSPIADHQSMRMNDDTSPTTQQSEPTTSSNSFSVVNSEMHRSSSSSNSLHQMTSRDSSKNLQQHQQQQQQREYVNPTTSLIDYNNQMTMMPTRQSSAITSQMLMLSQSASTSSAAPQYAMSSHYSTGNSFLPTSRNVFANQPQQSWKQQMPGNFLANLPNNSLSRPGILQSNSISSDPYMPQFLQSPHNNVILQSNDPMMAPTRSWWLDSPLTASVQSPLSVATPLPLPNQGGPSTPLNLMGSDSSATPPSALIQQVLDSPSRAGLRVGGTLMQRLEQPPILDKLQKSFTPITPQQQQMGGVDFSSSITRLRTSSLNVDSQSWKIPQIDTSQIYQQQNTGLTANVIRPSLINPSSSTPSAFGSPPIRSQPQPSPQIQTSLPPQQPPPQQQSQSQQTSVTPPAKATPQQQPQPQLHHPTPRSELPKIIPPPEMPRQKSCEIPPKSEHREPKEEPQMMSAPSSVKSMRKQVPDSTLHPEERKRILHLHAEQNRRSALKDGFDQLMDMIPDLYSGGVKPTNAVVLAKAADHIRKLQKTQKENEKKKEKIKAKIEKLNQQITALQTNLPASSNSASSSAQVDSKTSLENFFDRYTKEKSKADWRFWVMSKMLQPICTGNTNSFASCVAGETASRQDIAASCSDWIQQNWQPSELRPLASTLLVHLATNTDILTEPKSLEDYVAKNMKNPF